MKNYFFTLFSIFLLYYSVPAKPNFQYQYSPKINFRHNFDFCLKTKPNFQSISNYYVYMTWWFILLNYEWKTRTGNNTMREDLYTHLHSNSIPTVPSSELNVVGCQKLSFFLLKHDNWWKSFIYFQIVYEQVNVNTFIISTN